MACQTNWAGSSERTGSTALCASENTDTEVSSTRTPITITTFSFKAMTLHKCNFLTNLYCNSAFAWTSHHLSVHSNDVSDERTLLHWCDVSVGDPIGQGHLGAAGKHDVGAAVGDELRLVGQAAASHGAVGYRGEV